MKIILKQNEANIVASAVCIVAFLSFIVLVCVTNATPDDKLMISLMCGGLALFSVFTLLKSIYWRIVVQDDSFTFRNRWNKEKSYSYSDISAISLKGWCYVIQLTDQRIAVEYRAVPNCDYFLYVAKRHGVKTE